MPEPTYIISAAGGNITALQVLAAAKTRAEYEASGRHLIFANQDYQVEQAGFLILADNHFVMSGGEFCGNAARAAALVLSQIQQTPRPTFTMSGFTGTVYGVVEKLTGKKYKVECRFPGMLIKKTIVNIGQPASLVDLGGIIHVVIEGAFPADYEQQHRQIRRRLNLEKREAVGVIWAKPEGSAVKIHPVVWVRKVNSFFYESSCGSGSIAVAQVWPVSKIIQPSGGVIEVTTDRQDVILKSEMEIIGERSGGEKNKY